MSKNVFSFRAECQSDVDQVEVQLKQLPESFVLVSTPYEEGLPDVDVEIHTALEQRDIEGAMALVVDGHVMYQTLRPVALKDNDLTRDHSKWWPAQ